MSTKLPSFQFYPGDWQKEPTLRCISHAAKGVYVDMLCLMFECEDRGVLASGGTPWSDDQIAAAVGGDRRAALACIHELLAMGVVSRNQSGAILSRRMVRDEHVRHLANERQQRKRSRDRHGNVTPPEGEGEVEDAFREIAFDKFWDVFPRLRRKSKGKAREAWNKAYLKTKPEIIIAAAAEYAKTPEARGKYVKMPATWLNGECWEDDRAAWHADLDSDKAQNKLTGDANRAAGERARKEQQAGFARDKAEAKANPPPPEFNMVEAMKEKIAARAKQ